MDVLTRGELAKSANVRNINTILSKLPVTVKLDISIFSGRSRKEERLRARLVTQGVTPLGKSASAIHNNLPLADRYSGRLNHCW